MSTQPLIDQTATPTIPRSLPITLRSQYSLPERAIIFCNFNQLYKIDPPTLKVSRNSVENIYTVNSRYIEAGYNEIPAYSEM